MGVCIVCTDEDVYEGPLQSGTEEETVALNIRLHLRGTCTVVETGVVWGCVFYLRMTVMCTR